MRVEEIRSGEEVLAMIGGWGAKRIAEEFGCARNAVRPFLREGDIVSRGVERPLMVWTIGFGSVFPALRAMRRTIPNWPHLGREAIRRNYNAIANLKAPL